MTEKDIQKAVLGRFSKHEYKLLNSYVFGYNWESDFFSRTKTGYYYEVEVKISRADFKADFSKNKHKYFKGGTKGL